MNRFQRRFHPGEEESANGREMRGRKRQRRQGSVGNQVGEEVPVKLTGFGPGYTAQNRVPISLREYRDNTGAYEPEH